MVVFFRSSSFILSFFRFRRMVVSEGIFAKSEGENEWRHTGMTCQIRIDTRSQENRNRRGEGAGQASFEVR